MSLRSLNVTFPDGTPSLTEITEILFNESLPVIELNAELTVNVAVDNPNKFAFYLKNSDITTFYDNTSLATTEVLITCFMLQCMVSNQRELTFFSNRCQGLGSVQTQQEMLQGMWIFTHPFQLGSSISFWKTT